MSAWCTFQPPSVHPGTQAIEDYDSGLYYDKEDMAAFKASAEVAVGKFTYPVIVCDETGATLAHGSCFSFYSSKTRFLATSRSIADAQCVGPQNSSILTKVNGMWMLCEVLRSDEIAERMGKMYAVAVLELVGNCVAPAGVPLGTATGTLEGFVAGFSSVREGKAKFHLHEGALHQLSNFEFEVNACAHDSWSGGPVLDTSGHVIGVITGIKNGRVAATMAEHLTYYSALLGLKTPAYGG